MVEVTWLETWVSETVWNQTPGSQRVEVQCDEEGEIELVVSSRLAG